MTLALIGIATDNEREMSGYLVSQGYGRGCANREELFNQLSVELLCDYAYYSATHNLDQKQREEFDALLVQCGDATSNEKDPLIDRLIIDPRGEVEYV